MAELTPRMLNRWNPLALDEDYFVSDLKKGDAVQVLAGEHAGRHGVVDRVVVIRNESQRRAGHPGRTVYDVMVAGGVERYSVHSLRKSDVLDALGDL